MEMAGIVCHTGASIITEARKLVEKIGKPLELDTDGIWCLIPSSFPENITFSLTEGTRKKAVVSYPGAILNELVRQNFTNEQYHEIQNDGSYLVRSENSIFFEVDGPYLAMILPASKEEGKKLKKRYAVFNFDKSLAELKGFEMKRRGELSIIKYFQTAVFKAFLDGKSHEECYASVAKEADHWLNVLFTKGADLSDAELFDLISENRSMSKKLDDYEGQKSTSISTAKRLAEFLGDDMVKDAGLACQFIISRKPVGSPVTERAIPVAIFQAAPEVTAHYLKKWTKDQDIKKDNINIRDVIDWDYYLERVGGTIQKIVSIPAALQNVPNPVPRIPLPDWLESKRRQRVNDLTQPKITDVFKVQEETEEFIPDIENFTSSSFSTELSSNCTGTVLRDTSNTDKVGVRKRQRKNNELEGEGLGDNFSKRSRSEELVKRTIVNDGVVSWIRYLKEKWKLESESKKKGNRDSCSKKSNSLETMMETGRKIYYENHWQIIQFTELPEKGVFSFFAVVNGKMFKSSIRIPRIFYVNDRETSKKGSLVKKILPRMKQAFNLYRYSVDELRFQSRFDDINRELCSLHVEGMYESQVPLSFRILLELGCCCKLKEEARSVFMPKLISFEQLIMVPEADYLPEGCIRNLFYYEHRQDSRCIIAIFDNNTNEAFIVIVNKVSLDIPNLSVVYKNEKARLDETVVSLIKDGDIRFNIQQYVTSKDAEKAVQRYIKGIRQDDPFPIFVAVLSNETSCNLVRRIPVLGDVPLVRIHCTEPMDLLNVLDWQRMICKRIIQHYFNSFIYLRDYIDISRYLRIPIGNMSGDWSILGADLLFARTLCRSGHILWASPTTRPDLGGKEMDDYRISAEWEKLCVTERPNAIYNQESFETNVCTELELGAVAITAIIQDARIIEAEGGTDATGFISSLTLSADSLLGRVKTIAHYDEAAAVSGSLKVLRLFLQECIRDIHLHGNKIADQIIINVYRWLLSPLSLLYDPAIARAIDILITKLCLLLVAEINRLGGKVLYASSSRFVICTQRKEIDQGRGFVNGLIRSLKKNPLFAALHVEPVKYWNIFMWLDSKNYAGIEFGEDGKPDRSTVDKLSIAKVFPEEMTCRETFLMVILGYMQLIARRMKAVDDDDDTLTEFRRELVSTELSDRLFRICNKLSTVKQTLVMSKFLSNKVGITDVPLWFAKAVVKFISLDESVAVQVDKLRYQLCRLLEVVDGSAVSEWTSLEVSCAISQLFCTSCGQNNDLDACQEEAWICETCKNPYSVDTIEEILVERANQLILAYTLQDLRCKKCGTTKRDILSQYCECSGQYENMIEEEDLRFNFITLSRIAEHHQFGRLLEVCEWILL